MMRILCCLLLVLVLSSCGVSKDLTSESPYPLLSLFETNKSLDGATIKVAGYFGYWDSDIPVLYATREALQTTDGLYKSHIIYAYDAADKAMNSHLGKVCIFKAKIWYRGQVPTLDKASLIECR